MTAVLPVPSLKRLAIGLIGADLLLVFTYLVAVFFAWPGVTLFRLVNLDGEASLAAWLSSSQLLICGLTFAALASRESRNRAKTVFLLSAIGLVFLSADEAAAIHEKLTLLARYLGYRMESWNGHGAWIPLYIGAGVVFALATGKVWLSVWKEQRTPAMILLTGLSLLVCGAVLIELLGYGALRNPEMKSLYGLQVAAEESFEMVGVSLMLVGSVSLYLAHGNRTAS